MIGEYGYMEEGQLGKPYDLGLLRRLTHYAYPYKKMILFALLLTMLITLMDLARDAGFVKLAIATEQRKQ